MSEQIPLDPDRENEGSSSPPEDDEAGHAIPDREGGEWEDSPELERESREGSPS